MKILDGKGRGYTLGISSENRALVSSVSISAEREANENHGQAYNASFSQTPTAADDCIYYMENLAEQNIAIEGINLSVAGACEVYFQLKNTGTRNSATSITPANLNAGSGLEADGNFEQGADLDGGSATLTTATEIKRLVFRAATDSNYFNFEQDVIIPKNRQLTIWVDSTVAVTGEVVFHHSHPEEV